MASVIGQYFSKQETDALEHGSVDYETISPALMVSFAARRLDHRRVAWLNVRWFLQRGIDVLEDGERCRVEAWLLDEFGFAIVGEPSIWPAQDTKLFQADRYGSTEGTTPHGGSGRSGIAGRFCAKGLGVTPLVGRGAQLGHAHGCATLEECLREAIYGEVIDAEFPYGAIPVIGVIDTGLAFDDPDARTVDRRHVRRGILIRQCMLRPAHAERAPLFRAPAVSDDQHRLNQRQDTARTRAVVHDWLLGLTGEARAVQPRELVIRLARQIAFGQLHRISSGGMFSSNVSATGALLDFGNAHALPDWRHAKLLDHVAGFGDEMITLRAVVKSLAFYLTKYAPAGAHPMSEKELQNYAETSYREAFDDECLRLFNLSHSTAAAKQLVGILRAHFHQQQQRRVRYQHGQIVSRSTESRNTSWLGNIVACLDNNDPLATHSPLVREIDSYLRSAFRDAPHSERFIAGAYMTARRHFGVRGALDRGTLINVLTRLVEDVVRLPDSIAPKIEAAANQIIGMSRIHWPMLPLHLAVRAKKAIGHSCALACLNLITGGDVVWLEGVGHADGPYLFDRRLNYKHDELSGLQSSNGRWQASIPVASFVSWFSSDSEIPDIVRHASGAFESYDMTWVPFATR